MTRGGIREYVAAVRGRYVMASKAEKGKILDKFTQVTGCHRKAAMRLLLRKKKSLVSIKSVGILSGMVLLWLGR